MKLIVGWVKEVATKPVIVKLTPNISDITEPAIAARQGGGDAISLINTIQSIVGVDLDNFVPFTPVVDGKSTNGGYWWTCCKTNCSEHAENCAQHPEVNLPISGIGGVEN